MANNLEVKAFQVDQYYTVNLKIDGGLCSDESLEVIKGLACTDSSCVFKQKTGSNTWTLKFDNAGAYTIAGKAKVESRPEIEPKYDEVIINLGKVQPSQPVEPDIEEPDDGDGIREEYKFTGYIVYLATYTSSTTNNKNLHAEFLYSDKAAPGILSFSNKNFNLNAINLGDFAYGLENGDFIYNASESEKISKRTLVNYEIKKAASYAMSQPPKDPMNDCLFAIIIKETVDSTIKKVPYFIELSNEDHYVSEQVNNIEFEKYTCNGETYYIGKYYKQNPINLAARVLIKDSSSKSTAIKPVAASILPTGAVSFNALTKNYTDDDFFIDFDHTQQPSKPDTKPTQPTDPDTEDKNKPTTNPDPDNNKEPVTPNPGGDNTGKDENNNSQTSSFVEPQLLSTIYSETGLKNQPKTDIYINLDQLVPDDFANQTEWEKYVLAFSDALQSYGYNELSSLFTGNKINKLQTLYKRIFNALYLNGSSKGKGVIQCSINGDANIYPFNIVSYVNAFKSDPNAEIFKSVIIDSKELTTIFVPCEDLQLSQREQLYVKTIVLDDNPNLLGHALFYSYLGFKSQHGSILVYGYNNKENYLKACYTCLNEINKVIKDKLGYSYEEGLDFKRKNQKYNPAIQGKISRIIHDYIIYNTTYGYADYESDLALNQIMYPALETREEIDKQIIPYYSYIKNGEKIEHKNFPGNRPVCASYAMAYTWCCKQWGIHCISIVGGCKTQIADKSGYGFRDRHKWNANIFDQDVSIKDLKDDKSHWLFTDLTWDDTDSGLKNEFLKEMSWAYFNRGGQELYLDKIFNGNYTRKSFTTNYQNLENRLIDEEFIAPIEPTKDYTIPIESYGYYPSMIFGGNNGSPTYGYEKNGKPCATKQTYEALNLKYPGALSQGEYMTW